MSLTLSDADLQKIADQLFLLKSPKVTPLPKPTNSTGSNSLELKLDPIANDPRFKDIGIGVVDFTDDVMNPRVWLHNGNDAWRIASTAKIAILLAAIQLRDDVRRVKATGLISNSTDFDDLFATIWRKSSNSGTRQIAEKGSAPRISTIFDLTTGVPKFIGEPSPLAVDSKGIFSRLPSTKHLTWPTAPSFSFWERLWLMGGLSDNLAASTCISEIGLAYIKAVLRTYGLFDQTKHGMRLLLGWGYSGVNVNTRVNTSPAAPNYRPLQNRGTTDVRDKFRNSNRTHQAGSAAALTAYMIALMQDKLVDKDGCDTIRMHLANGGPMSTVSYISEGVRDSGAIVSKEYSKIGILGSLLCEFAYLESGGLKYAVLALGILPKRVSATTFDSVDQAKDLGNAIHKALAP